VRNAGAFFTLEAKTPAAQNFWLDAVQSSGSPKTNGAILIAGCSFYFGMGALSLVKA